MKYILMTISFFNLKSRFEFVARKKVHNFVNVSLQNITEVIFQIEKTFLIQTEEKPNSIIYNYSL